MSPTPTAIPTMTHRPEEDTFGVSVVFSPEIESTYMKYYEVSQEHMVKVENKPRFRSISFSHCTYYLQVPLWLACFTASFKKYFRSVIDWIEIIFSSEDFNRDLGDCTKNKLGTRLFGFPNYRGKLFASNSFIPALWLLWFIVYCLYFVFIWSIKTLY